MKRAFLSLSFVAAAALLAAACGPAAPSPTAAPTKAAAAAVPAPTQPPAQAAPTKAPEPTKAVEAAPKVDFPAKGKTITMIVPWPPGGPVDVSVRIIAPFMEKDLGVPIQIVNKAGASSQIGLTDLVQAKPDGYTIIATNQPATSLTYLDPQNKAVYGRKDLQPVAMYDAHPNSIGVNAKSSFKTVKDLVDAAKAKPQSVKLAGVGLMAAGTFVIMQLEEQSGAQFAMVQFDGAAPAVTAVLGGHADGAVVNITAVISQVKSGQLAVAGITDTQQTKFLPGVKTFAEQGYKVYSVSTEGLTVPAGTPKEVVNILANSVKKALNDPDVKKKLDDMAYDIRYMDPDQYSKDWDQWEATMKPLIPKVRR